ARGNFDRPATGPWRDPGLGFVDQPDLAAFHVLGSTPYQPLVRQGFQGGIVEHGERRSNAAAVHWITSASQSAKRSGVSAAIFMPASARRPAVPRSKSGTASA